MNTLFPALLLSIFRYTKMKSYLCNFRKWYFNQRWTGRNSSPINWLIQVLFLLLKALKQTKLNKARVEHANRARPTWSAKHLTCERRTKCAKPTWSAKQVTRETRTKCAKPARRAKRCQRERKKKVSFNGPLSYYVILPGEFPTNARLFTRIRWNYLD